MKAVAVFPAQRRVAVVAHEKPQLAGPCTARVRTVEVGICGTDKEIVSFAYGTPPPGSPYLILGHEALGRVAEVARDVAALRPGDLVVPMVRRPCPHDSCLPCRTGRQDFCTTGDFTERGIKGAHGFLAECFVEEDRFLVPVPPDLRDVAVLVEPLSIAEKALRQVEQVQRRLPWGCPGGQVEPTVRHRALVLGAGPVGLLGAMALVRRGFETFVYSREAPNGPKAEVVSALGARYLSALSFSPEQAAAEMGSIDLVYEAVGASRLAFEVMPLLGPNAVFVFTGVPGRKAPVEVDTDRIMRNLVLRNQVVFGTVNADRSAYEQAVEDLRTWCAERPRVVRSLLTGRFSLDEAPARLRSGMGGIKNVVVVESD